MTERYLLFVDDLEQQRVLFKDAVDDWNENNPGRQFAVKPVASYDEAIEALQRGRFDGALFDLRLPSGGTIAPERPLGNELAKRGLHENGIPVAIISAKPDEIDQQFLDSNTVKVIYKGDGDAFAKAIAWFGELWPMLDSMAAARLKIRKISAGLFSDRIWPRWQASYVNMTGNEELTSVLARQFVWHLGEVMGLGGETDELWHPLEAWMCPALNESRLATGDVLEHDEALWIVLSPACDLANDGKVESFLLVRCDRDIPSDWNDFVERCASSDPAQADKARKLLAKMFNQSVPSQHFLPPLPDDPRAIVVKFTHMLTIPMAEMDAFLGKRKGSVAAPFVSNLIQRFGAYISRVGQPNLNVSLFPRADKLPVTDGA